jgi:hypothetical protein
VSLLRIENHHKDKRNTTPVSPTANQTQLTAATRDYEHVIGLKKAPK